MKTPYVVVLVTTANKQEAEKIVTNLVERKLVACGNIVSGIKSVFRWANNIETAEECLVILKTRRDLFGKITETVKKLHSYKVPEIIAFEIVNGAKDYLDWLENSLSS